MSHPLQIPIKVLRSHIPGRRPGDGVFRALQDGELFLNTADETLCYLNVGGTLVTVAFASGGATEAWVSGQITTAIAALIAGAPSTLDTLNEIAGRLANDESIEGALNNTVATLAASRAAKGANSDITSLTGITGEIRGATNVVSVVGSFTIGNFTNVNTNTLATHTLVIINPAQSGITLTDAAAATRYVVGRSLFADNTQNFFIWDAIIGPVLQIDATGIVSFPIGYKRDNPGVRNRLFNGDFNIWARGDSFTIPPSNSAHTADGWIVGQTTGVTLSVFHIISGLHIGWITNTHLMSYSCTNPTGGYVDYIQQIESYTARDLEDSPCMLSFEINAHPSITHGDVFVGAFPSLDNPSGILYSAPVGFPITGGATRPTVAIPGAYLANAKNGLSVLIRTYVPAVTGTVSANLTRVQFEKGIIANDFEFRPIASENLLAQRHYQNTGFLYGYASDPTHIVVNWHSLVQMRAIPTVILNSSTPFCECPPMNAGHLGSGSTITAVHNASVLSFDIQIGGFSGLPTGSIASLTPGWLSFSAEIYL